MSLVILKTSRTWFLAAAVMFVMCCYPGLTGAMTYTVGDDAGWAVPTNSSYYQTWAANKTFVVGDALNFNWTENHTVAFVNESDYKGCTKVDTIVIGSPGVIPLDTSGPQYYICTVSSHCSLGQKLAITVEASTTNPAAPSPLSAASSMSIDFFSVHVLPVAYYGVLILVIFV